jgi:chemotaxis protein methyltransferase CheR
MIAETEIFTAPETMADGDYDYLCRLIYEHSRISLGTDKRALVNARVAKRLRVLKLPSYEAYCRHLRGGGGREELGQLVDVISTNHTNFFRENQHFQWLEKTILPAWAARPHGQMFRVWSAACSSGEEPFTLAIVLAEFFRDNSLWAIDGTDICTRVLNHARTSVYDHEKLEPVRPDLLRKYFQRGVGQWEGYCRVKDDLRNRISFHHLNLFQPEYPFSHQFDVIFCRNVMIYFDRPTQETLVARLAEKLVPGGHLVVGHSESLGNIRHSLRQLQPTIYQKPGGR